MKFTYTVFSVVLALLLATSFAFGQDLSDTPQPFPASNCVTISISSKKFGQIYYVESTKNTREIFVSMRSISSDIDPDLYIRANKIPETNMYDEADLSPNDFVELFHHPEEEDLKEGTKFYIGVYGFSGNGLVEVCARAYDCINRSCGSSGTEQAGTCEVETGECKCEPGFDGPGCAYRVTEAEVETTYTSKLRAFSTVAFTYNISEEQKASYLHFAVSRKKLNSWLVIRARQGEMPTEEDADFDAHVPPTASFGEVHINRRNFNPGKWFVTVSTEYVSESETADFDLTGHLYICRSNCSGHGECDTTELKCKCEADYSAASDCSVYSKKLLPGNELEVKVASTSSSSFYFQVTKAQALLNIDFAVHFDVKTSLTHNRYPRVYIGRGDPTSGRRTNRDSYIAASPEPPTQFQTLHISDHDAETDVFQGIIYNDYTEPIEGVLKISVTPFCPNDCSKHGECLQSGVCQCEKGYHSNDCSVSDKECVAELGTKSTGVKKPISALVIVASMIIAAIVGPFLFKFLNKKKRQAEGRAPRREAGAVPDSADDNQYSELN